MSEHTRIQRKKSGERDIAPPIIHEALQSGGEPLDEATRGFMEPRFGYDFGGVRVHTDETATQSAEAVSAYAYTVGRDVVFGAEQYRPGTEAGRQLIAHELTHVVQQASGPVSGVPIGDGLQISEPHDLYEQEAEKTVSQLRSSVASDPGRQSEHIRSLPITTNNAIQRAFWNGKDLENDFWGTKDLLGKKWGGVADAGLGAAWNLASAVPAFGTVVSLLGAEIDAGKAGASYALGDRNAAEHFSNDAIASVAGAIPIWGTGQGAVLGLWDAASAIDRATGGEEAPLSTDIIDKLLEY